MESEVRARPCKENDVGPMEPPLRGGMTNEAARMGERNDERMTNGGQNDERYDERRKLGWLFASCRVC